MELCAPTRHKTRFNGQEHQENEWFLSRGIKGKRLAGNRENARAPAKMPVDMAGCTNPSGIDVLPNCSGSGGSAQGPVPVRGVGDRIQVGIKEK